MIVDREQSLDECSSPGKHGDSLFVRGGQVRDIEDGVDKFGSWQIIWNIPRRQGGGSIDQSMFQMEFEIQVLRIQHYTRVIGNMCEYIRLRRSWLRVGTVQWGRCRSELNRKGLINGFLKLLMGPTLLKT